MNRTAIAALPEKTTTRPPSPATTLSTITQSTSNSNSVSVASTSPPQPITPPHPSRSRARYPDLGRVPLHRRGTEQTYERLEDLLREAGYKEIRVFTPETDRHHGNVDDEDRPDRRSGALGGVGALVGYLTGLMPSAMASRTSLHVGSEDEHSIGVEQKKLTQTHPASATPFSQRQPRRQETASSTDTSYATSSMQSLEPTPRPSRAGTISRPSTPIQHNSIYSQSPSPSTVDLHRPPFVHRASDHSLSRAPRRSRPISSVPNAPPGIHITPSSSPSLADRSLRATTHPRPSRAGAYLRHMASAPNMPKRPISSPLHPLTQHHRPHQQPRRTLDLNDSDPETSVLISEQDENAEASEPPLPRTWLETVARAVLFGGIGAYIGGPASSGRHSANWDQGHSSSPSRDSSQFLAKQQQRKMLRQTRSFMAHGVSSKPKTPSTRSMGLMDRTNPAFRSGGSAGLAPPELFTRLERGKAGMSAGEVSHTKVVCRSAPASRANSRTRDEGRTDRKERAGGGKERRGRKREREKLPSLASTNVEGDAWEVRKTRTVVAVERDSESAIARSRYLSGWSVDAQPSSAESESEDDEGELGLAQMLVNPKRQNSIKSLRKHLSAQRGVGGGEGSIMARQRGVSASDDGAHKGRVGVKQSIREEEWYGSEVEEWGQGWARKGTKRRGTSEDDDDDAAGFFAGGRRMHGSGGSTNGKNGRSRLPGPWALIGGSS